VNSSLGPVVLCETVRLHTGSSHLIDLLSLAGWVDGSWVEGQAGVGQEPGHQVLVLADPLGALFSGVGDLGQGGRREVGEFDLLEVAHRPSTGFSSGRIGRQPLNAQPVALAVEPSPHPSAPMGR
jgi:hypothetical protein